MVCARHLCMVWGRSWSYRTVATERGGSWYVSVSFEWYVWARARYSFPCAMFGRSYQSIRDCSERRSFGLVPVHAADITPGMREQESAALVSPPPALGR